MQRWCSRQACCGADGHAGLLFAARVWSPWMQGTCRLASVRGTPWRQCGSRGRRPHPVLGEHSCLERGALSRSLPLWTRVPFHHGCTAPAISACRVENQHQNVAQGGAAAPLLRSSASGNKKSQLQQSLVCAHPKLWTEKLWTELVRSLLDPCSFTTPGAYQHLPSLSTECCKGKRCWCSKVRFGNIFVCLCALSL